MLLESFRSSKKERGKRVRKGFDYLWQYIIREVEVADPKFSIVSVSRLLSVPLSGQRSTAPKLLRNEDNNRYYQSVIKTLFRLLPAAIPTDPSESFYRIVFRNFSVSSSLWVLSLIFLGTRVSYGLNTPRKSAYI